MHAQGETVKTSENKSRPAICANCQNWNEENNKEKNRIGECRRFPPAAVALDEESAAFIWPTTGFKDFCGEYKPRCDA